MFIPPIERLTMAQKSQEASHTKQNEHQKGIAENVDFAAIYEKRTKEESNHVVQTEAEEKYQYDAKEKKEKNKREQEKQKRKKEQKDKQVQINKQEKITKFDVRI